MQENPTIYFRAWGLDNISYGPVELPALVDWIREGRVLPGTWVFSEQKGEWSRASEMTELKGLFKSRVGAAVAANTHEAKSLRRMRILADMDERREALDGVNNTGCNAIELLASCRNNGRLGNRRRAQRRQL